MTTTRPTKNDLSYRRWIAYVTEGASREERQQRLQHAPDFMRDNIRQEILWNYEKAKARKAYTERRNAGGLKNGPPAVAQ